jgi:hypothetical protein
LKENGRIAARLARVLGPDRITLWRFCFRTGQGTMDGSVVGQWGQRHRP